MIAHEILKAFASQFGTEPLLVRSPGRINLIGEHTDYNEGYVLPAAIDKEMILAVAQNNTNSCRLYSLDYNERVEVSLDAIRPSATAWANYLLGVVDQLQKAGYPLSGFDCAFGGDIPIGAGLSSSAALECGTAYALSQLFDLRIDRQLLIRYAQKAEHTFAGVQCGIMDQFASVMGKENHALQLDCRSLEYAYFPLELGQYQIILLDTQVKHSLASSEYNTRRLECEQGVAAVQQQHPHVKSLRDVSLPMLAAV
jgi:galactokinase